MAHMINKIGVMPRMSKRANNLSCTNNCEKPLNKRFYDNEEIQKRINDAAKEKVRLEYEIKKRYENLKHINFLG